MEYSIVIYNEDGLIKESHKLKLTPKEFLTLKEAKIAEKSIQTIDQIMNNMMAVKLN